MSWAFFDPDKDIEKHGPILPHWQQGDIFQFVTFRLADSLPQSLLKKWQAERKTWLHHHPQPWTDEVKHQHDQRFPAQLEEWLDAGHGSCLLRNPSYRDHLESTLMRFHGEKVVHEAWIIMPNHVHLLFRPLIELEDLIKAWKGVSARLIGQGPIWQQNYRDTLIRSPQHFARCIRYIRSNPSKARLPADDYTLWESDRAREVP